MNFAIVSLSRWDPFLLTDLQTLLTPLSAKSNVTFSSNNKKKQLSRSFWWRHDKNTWPHVVETRTTLFWIMLYQSGQYVSNVSTGIGSRPIGARPFGFPGLVLRSAESLNKLQERPQKQTIARSKRTWKKNRRGLGLQIRKKIQLPWGKK